MFNKRILTALPEYYLIFLSFLAGYKPPFSIHPFALGLIAILILQIIFKNKITGVIIAALFALTNLYMLFGLISEFNEFPEFNADAGQLLGVGLSIFIFNLIISGVMGFRYAQKLKGDSILTRNHN